MSDVILAPLQRHPWYKRTWGILLIIFAAVTVLFLAWFSYLVYDNIQRIKSGDLKSVTSFDGDFTKNAGKKKNTVGTKADLVPPTSPIRGQQDAGITIVQFGDFQCPFSAKEFPIIRPIMENASRLGIKFVYRDFPLIDIHPDAVRAAEASHCAQDQGKYWAFHDQLFLNQSDLSEAGLKKYAIAIGLDEEKFNACLQKGTHKARVLKDVQDGLTLGVRGTPTFFINGLKIEGAIPKAAWDAILERLKTL